MKKKVIIIFSVFMLGIYIGTIFDGLNVSPNKQIVRYSREEDYNIDTSIYMSVEYENTFAPTKIREGVIPDEERAARIAYEYVSAVFGEDHAIREQPYRVSLVNEQLWAINGCSQKGEGGSFGILIEKTTGNILSIKHGK